MPNEIKELFEKPFDKVTMGEAIVMSFFNKEEAFKRIDYISNNKAQIEQTKPKKALHLVK